MLWLLRGRILGQGRPIDHEEAKMIVAVEIKEEQHVGITGVLLTRLFFPDREKNPKIIERRTINEGRRTEAKWRARLFIIDRLEKAGLKMIAQEGVFKEDNSESRIYYFQVPEGFNPDLI